MIKKLIASYKKWKEQRALDNLKSMSDSWMKSYIYDTGKRNN